MFKHPKGDKMSTTKSIHNIEELYAAVEQYENSSKLQVKKKKEQEQRITILEEQIRDLLQQQKNLLKFIKELGEVIMETRIDNSAK